MDTRVKQYNAVMKLEWIFTRIDDPANTKTANKWTRNSANSNSWDSFIAGYWVIQLTSVNRPKVDVSVVLVKKKDLVHTELLQTYPINYVRDCYDGTWYPFTKLLVFALCLSTCVKKQINHFNKYTPFYLR